MKPLNFKRLASITSITFVCLGLPAIAQPKGPATDSGEYSRAISNRNPNLAAEALSGTIIGLPFSASGSPSKDHWIPVRNEKHGVWERHDLRVPEGGAPLGYLLLAAFSVFGAVVLSRRRQA